MNVAFELLMLAALLGAVDVGYYHLYKFRLFSRPESVKEEITHLARHVLFLSMTSVMVLGLERASTVLPILFVLDLANSTADVLLERKSRASAGGLPSLEYLIHILASLISGAAMSAFIFAPPGPLTELQVIRGTATIAIGVVLFAVETTLFLRCVLFSEPRSALVER